jgi:hypothetical protein
MSFVAAVMNKMIVVAAVAAAKFDNTITYGKNAIQKRHTNRTVCLFC